MKQNRIAVMAGTTEGRLLAEFLENNRIGAVILVATEYGEKVLPNFSYCRVHAGRFDERQLTQFFAENEITHVYDATHPYAKEVSMNCQNACNSLAIVYRRILRENIDAEDYLPKEQFERFDTLMQAVDFLKETEGNVLVTTGGKETDVFTKLPGFEQRVVLRVLPDEALKEQLRQRGFCSKQIIMGQGPFGIEENIKIIREFDIRYLISKESGIKGGLAEKLVAAYQTDTFVLLIKRPTETGITLTQAQEELIRLCNV